MRAIGKHKWLFVICLLFLMAGILRINDLSLITPDSSRYLIWGNSLAHFRGLVDDTQPEPERYVVHAPLYSLVIAPVEVFFPYSTQAVKLWTLLWGVLAIILFYFWLCRHFGTTIALSGTIIFAGSPLLLVYSTEVLSEAPFLVLIILIFLLSEKMGTSVSSSRGETALLAVSVAFCALLREAGIAAVISASLFFFLCKKRKFAGVLLGSAVVLMVLWYLRNNFLTGPVSPSQSANTELVFQHFVTAPETPLAKELALRTWLSLKEHSLQLGGMLLYPLYLTRQFRFNVLPTALHQTLLDFMPAVKYLILALTIPLILFGVYTDLRRSRTGILRFVYCLIYLAVILVYPAQDIRFLLPLLPLMIYYIAVSVRFYQERKGVTSSRVLALYSSAAAVFLMIPNLSSDYEILKINREYTNSPEAFYRKLTALPTYPLMFTQPWSIMGEWIRSNLPDSAMLASPSKELSTVVGKRRVLEIEQRSPLPVFESLLRDNSVDYLLSPARRDNFTVFEFVMSESRRFWFEPVYSTANLYLFRVHSRLAEPPPIDVSNHPSRDSTNASALLRQARVCLLNEDYILAGRLLTQAQLQDPAHPEILFQNTVLKALQGDTASAEANYQKLFMLPQALGYALPARKQLEVMRMLSEARRQSFPASSAVQAFNAATLYWKMGYYRHAATIMDAVIQADSTYFTGLLWALHFHLQIGDTTRARKYLSILENIEWTNPVVQAFERVLAIGDSLCSATSPLDRSDLHLEIGLIYKKIELNEEAIDEAEKALHENTRNTPARLLMGQVFEIKKMPRRAEKSYLQALEADPGNITARTKLDSLKHAFLKGN